MKSVRQSLHFVAPLVGISGRGSSVGHFELVLQERMSNSIWSRWPRWRQAWGGLWFLKFGADTNLDSFPIFFLFIHGSTVASACSLWPFIVWAVFLSLDRAHCVVQRLLTRKGSHFFSFKDIFYSYVHLHSLRLLRDGWCCARSGGFIFLEAVCLAFL